MLKILYPFYLTNFSKPFVHDPNNSMLYFLFDLSNIS